MNMKGIPLGLGLLLFFAALTIIWVLTLRYRLRELQHRERMAAIEKGISVPAPTDFSEVGSTTRSYLLRGMIWLFTGVALVGCLLGISLTTRTTPSLGDRVYQAKYLKEIGAAPEQIQAALTDTTAVYDLPPGLAFLGVIPAAVGLAYLTFYRSEMNRSK
jgi:hypothetical protein